MVHLRGHTSTASAAGDEVGTGRCHVESLGSNVQYEVKDGKLVIVVDLSQTFGRSKSGKTTIVATTSGGQRVPGTEVTVGLNVYR